LAGATGLEPVHNKEAGRDVALGEAPEEEDSGSVAYRGASDVAMKKGAEGTQALEADLETDIGDRELARRKQLLRPLDSPLGEILMRGSVEDLPEEPQEVITRQARLARDLVQVEGKVIAVVDELAGPREPAIGIGVRRLQSNQA